MNIDIFQSFAKQNNDKLVGNNKAVIYTRVSDVKQKNNTSLASQKEICTEFALRNGYQIYAYFGGTYESAKTDDRKAYKEMLAYVKSKKVTNIIVHSLDRYSRTGGLAITTIESLKKKGIKVISISQNVDSDTPTGTFMQNFHLLYSRYDNDIRREKTITGMRHRLQNGYWMGTAPLGYKNARNEQNIPILVLSDDAHYIKKAFTWKVNEEITNVEIQERLKKIGFKIYQQRLSRMFRNPVYCGMLSHSLLEGKVVKGNHPSIVSKDVFLKANGMTGYKSEHNVANENLPLKVFVRCKACQSPLTGFLVKKKGLYYYKCKTNGCSCTRNNNILHQQFRDLLSIYKLEEYFIEPIRKQLEFTFEYHNKSNIDNSANHKYALKAVQEKIDNMQERFVLGKIEGDLYHKFIEKFEEEKREIEKEIQNNSLDSSNLNFYIKESLRLFSNLHTIWELSTYKVKQELQKLLFPGGIEYDRKNDRVQTSKVNSVLELTRCLSDTLKNKKSGQRKNLFPLSAPVTSAGFKPATS